MKRRAFIAGLGGAVAWPVMARAQENSRRLGFLCVGLPSDAFGKGIINAFLQGLSALGWHEGANLHIDWRWYAADAALAKRQAAELIALNPDVLLAGGNPALETLSQQTQAIPIVFALVQDPLGMGYVENLAHPGRNVTGFETYDPPIYTKELQLFTEITPLITNVGAIYNPETAPYGSRMVRVMADASKPLAMNVRDVQCRSIAEVEAAMIMMAQENGGALALGEVFTQLHRVEIADLAIKYRVPLVAATRQVIESGGLMSYAIDLFDLFRRSAAYIDRVMKGEKPAELPVQAPTKFELLNQS